MLFAVIDPCSWFILGLIGMGILGTKMLKAAKANPKTGEMATNALAAFLKKLFR